MGIAINRVIKKNIFVLVLSTIVLILLITGISFAYFIKEDTSSSNQIISVGSIDASLSSSSQVLSITNLSPKKYEDLDENENVYSFTISNTGSYALKYEVYLIDNTESFISNCIDIGGCIDYSDIPLEKKYFKYINYRLDNDFDTFDEINTSGKKVLGMGTILSGEAKTYTIQIWLDSTSSNDVIGKTASFNIKLDAVAVDSPIETESDDLDVGDIVSIGNEEFYVLSKSDGSVRMISKYNVRTGFDMNGINLYPVDSEEELYNRQDIESISYTNGNNNAKSLINFTDEEHSINQEMCGEVPCYNNYRGSLLEEKIKNYGEYLKDILGADIVVDAPTYEDVNILQTIPDYYKTSFWVRGDTNSSYQDASIVYLDTIQTVDSTALLTNYSGIRPVIMANLGNVRKKVYKNSSEVNVEKDTLENDELVTGSIVSIGEEKFYVISVENDIVRLLAKENLNCGYKNAELIDVNRDTIAQQKTSDYSISLPFSSSLEEENQSLCLDNLGNKVTCYSSYKHSNLEKYNELYREALMKRYGVSVRVDLLQEEDLNNLSYSRLTKSFGSNKLEWVYSTNYWTKIAKDANNINAILSSNKLETKHFDSSDIGLRPVIIIHKNQISNL